MNEFMACAAKIRPDYCHFETNVCCFSCEHNSECTEWAMKNKLMRPCTPAIFEEQEVCEFAI